MGEIFSGIDTLRGADRKYVVHALNPETAGTIFRARLAANYDQRTQIKEDPVEQLGAPPERLRRAGRMNAAGIRAFYGAFDIDTCVAELRPQIGQTVVAAAFNVIRPVYVLDTTRFEQPMKPESPFSANYIEKYESWSFMEQFVREVARPISTDDEHLDYIPTQAVVEFLQHHFPMKRRGKPVKIEGVIYRSAQNASGQNIVLFDSAAGVHSSEQLVDDESLDEDIAPPIWLEAEEEPTLRLDVAEVTEHEVCSATFGRRPLYMRPSGLSYEDY